MAGRQCAVGCGRRAALGFCTLALPGGGRRLDGWQASPPIAGGLAAADEVENRFPPDPWPYPPKPRIEIDPDSGPAMITLEYRIDPSKDREDFVSARSRDLRRIRPGRETGAGVLGACSSISNGPDRFRRAFYNRDLGRAILRQHERMISSDGRLCESREIVSGWRCDHHPLGSTRTRVAGRNTGSFKIIPSSDPRRTRPPGNPRPGEQRTGLQHHCRGFRHQRSKQRQPAPSATTASGNRNPGNPRNPAPGNTPRPQSKSTASSKQADPSLKKVRL